MSRHLTIALLALVLSFSILAVASVSISPAIPDIVIVEDRDKAGAPDDLGYTFTDAFDFQDYLAVEGVTRDQIYWSFVSDDADGIGAAASILKVTTVGDYGAGDANITGVGQPGGPITVPTLSVFEDPVSEQAWEDITFTADTTFGGEDDTDTSSIRVWYLEAGEDIGFGGEDRDRLITEFATDEVWNEDWSDFTWQYDNIYVGQNLQFGDAVIDGNAAEVASVSDNQLTLSFGADDVYTVIYGPTIDVEAGKTYVVDIPIYVDYTKAGAGVDSFPIVRLMALNMMEGWTKGPDNLMYGGYAVAENDWVTYRLAFTAEASNEDFFVRIDIGNVVQEAFDIYVDPITVSEITGYPAEAVWTENWDSMDWSYDNIYVGQNLQFGDAVIDGNAAEIASVSDNVLTLAFGADDVYTVLVGPDFDVAPNTSYLVKVPIHVDYAKVGTGVDSYPIVRLMALGMHDGWTKGPDNLMYGGYPVAEEEWVNYYLIYTAEDAAEDFFVRFDIGNVVQEAFDVEIGAVEIFVID